MGTEVLGNLPFQNLLGMGGMNYGPFGSLVCDVWKGGGLEPDRRQWVVKGRQERKWFRTTKGRVWGEGNRVRVPVF